MKNTKIELAQLATESFESMEFYRKLFNSMSDAERNELSIGLKSRGEYARENYEEAKARFEHYTAQLAV